MELKPIPSYPGYKITREGQVWSDKSNWWLKTKIAKFGRNKLISYNTVNLFTADKKVCVVPIHRLLLDTFVEPRPEGMVCRHLDGDSLNNDLDNLCWGTYLENTQDMTRHYAQGKLVIKQLKLLKGGTMELKPLTEEQAKEANWPCWMCVHHLGSHTPEKEVCRRCRRVTENSKPINFELQTAVLIPSSPRGEPGHTIKRS